MAFKRHDQQSGGGGFKRNTQQEPSILDRVVGSLNETGRNTREAVTDRPLQSAQDLVRTGGSNISFGLTDRLNSLINNVPIEEQVAKTDAADTRLGSWDDATNIASMALMPSMAAAKYGGKAVDAAGKWGPRLWNAGKSALGFGSEGAVQGGVQASLQGRGKDDILAAMVGGGVGGSGGSVLGDVASGISNKMFYGSPIQDLPSFKKPMDLVNAGTEAKLNTREGKDTFRRANIMKDFLRAETKGPAGFQKMDEDIQKRGPQSMKLPFEFEESVSKLAQPKGGWKQSAANALDFGGGWGKLAASKLLGGAPVAGAAGLRLADDLGGKLDKKTLMKAKSLLLQGTTRGVNPDMTPEMRDELRNYLAKMSMGAARTNQ
jgi:hypothetical protein